MKNSYFFAPLTSLKDFSLEKTPMKFGILLAYLYLCGQLWY